MKKEDAISQLGGSIASVAEAVGVTYQAVHRWPEILPQHLEDRVLAAWARKHVLDIPAPYQRTPVRMPTRAKRPKVPA